MNSKVCALCIYGKHHDYSTRKIKCMIESYEEFPMDHSCRKFKRNYKKTIVETGVKTNVDTSR